ncbi:T9SS type A sorting domain-containing protein [Pontibacter sp. Tf4]|uniref:GDSL-type esterase/lipase family protein n=1 Tax=Pontibacter sp. Tf4 TaxID=2761620 RepID=UPI001628AFB7|nr:GDSL-type esterase/lipase family protein [Pontibacter sp. Tf4]MBB6612797.1 T9SS type A sorting domain-containing protein [Pontibacter sp. Tf4]
MHLHVVKIFYRLILFLLLFTLPQLLAAQPARIMCLGNSITQGDENYASYRFPLWKKLVDAGAEFEFVGSHNKNKWGADSPQQNATYKGKTFTNVNEAHWGWRTDQILQGNEDDQAAGKLADWLQLYTPDYALLHLGTNDVFQGQPNTQTIEEIKEVIRQLRGKNPVVRILLAKLIPTTRDKTASDEIVALNNLIGTLAQNLNTAASPVIVVDQYSGFDTATMLRDAAHPNDLGDQKMAETWYNAIAPLIAPLPVTLVSFSATVTPENKVQLNWATASEQNNAYFEIQRTLDTTGQFTTIGKVAGAGTTQLPVNYSYVDETAPMGELYYRLKQVDYNGKITYSATVHASAIPDDRMLQVYPTVVAQEPVTIDILLRQANAPVTISVYTITGKHVKDLTGATDAAGHFNYKLNTADLDGSGLYLVRAVVGTTELQKKFIVK